MHKYTYWLYVNGVHCQDYTVTASSDAEAMQTLRNSTWFEQFKLVKIEPAC